MKKFYLLTGLFLFLNYANGQQFKFDNIKYKTVFPEDLCKSLKGEKDFLLLDVRSPGEFSDTSSSTSYNLGHLATAKNIPVNDLKDRWGEINSFKNKPVYVYCSHSQRSRRASSLLADSGFTNVININGGMTQLLKKQNELNGCFKNIYRTYSPYTLVSPAQLDEKTKKSNPYFIIDIRPDSIFKGISPLTKQNAFGRFKEATNIMSSMFEGNLSSIPSDKPILLIDESGNESGEAAVLLNNLGFSNISVLMEGMMGWMEYAVSNENNSSLHLISNIPFKIISDITFHNMLQNNPASVVIDIRDSLQYVNQSQKPWENLGRIKNAINIPFNQISSKSELLPKDLKTQIILYHFNNQQDVFEAGKMLAAKGYTNVNILYGGLWNLRWASHNQKGKVFLNDYVIDVPEGNL